MKHNTNIGRIKTLTEIKPIQIKDVNQIKQEQITTMNKSRTEHKDIKYQLQALFYSNKEQQEYLDSNLGPGTYNNPKTIGGSEYLNRSPKFKFNGRNNNNNVAF